MIFFKLVLSLFLLESLQTKLLAESYTNRVLYLVDERPHCYLFRGNLPEKEGRFCYEELKQQIHTYLSLEGKELVEDFDLICLSFLNFYDASSIESKWFASNSAKGCFFRHPIYGAFFDPCCQSSSLRNKTLCMQRDGLQPLLYTLNAWLETGHDCVIYMHCYAGKDRTGEVAACYQMQYKGCSYQEAVELSQQIARRNLRWVSLNAIRWYAYYLRDVCGFTTIGVVK